MRRPLWSLFCVLCIGILIAKNVTIPISYLFLFFACFLFGSVLFFKKDFISTCFLYISVLLLGGLLYFHSILLPKNHIAKILDITRPRRVVLIGRVLSPSETRKTFYGKQYSKFVLSAEGLIYKGLKRKVKGKVLVLAYVPKLILAPTQKVQLYGRLSLPRRATNPGQFDYREYLSRRDIYTILKVDKSRNIKVLGYGPNFSVSKFSYRIRDYIKDLIERYIHYPQSDVLKAMLLGDRTAVSYRMNDIFLKTGTMHILAVSGLHIGLLVTLFIIILRLLRLPEVVRVIFIFMSLVIYCFIVNFRPSATRSAIMIAILILGRYLRKEADPINTLALSGIILLVINPKQLLDVGFQLSFLTVGAILFTYPKISKSLFQGKVLKLKSKLSFAKEIFIKAFIVSVVAWVASAPLVARYFNIVTPLSIFINIFVCLILYLIMAESILFCFVSFLSDNLAYIFSHNVNVSISLLINSINSMARLPFAYLRVPTPKWWLIFGFYFLIIIFINRKRLHIKTVYFVILLLLMANSIIWAKVYSFKTNKLRLSFLDVGNGDAILIEFPYNGGNILIDGGKAYGYDMGRFVVAPYLWSRGIVSLDMVVATHPDNDHLGGLVYILDNFVVRNYADNGIKADTEIYIKCEQILTKRDIHRYILHRGDRIKGFKDVTIEVLNPPFYKFSDDNNNSIALRLTYKDFSALFLADIEGKAFKDIFTNNVNKLSATVVKIPHHGYGFGDMIGDFVTDIAPKISIISTGAERPLSVIADTFKRNKIKSRILSTNESGCIFIISDGKIHKIKPFVKN